MTGDEIYTTPLQHVLAELTRLDLLLRMQVWRRRQSGGATEEGWLLSTSPMPRLTSSWTSRSVVRGNIDVPDNAIAQWEQLGAEITDRMNESARQGRIPSRTRFTVPAPLAQHQLVTLRHDLDHHLCSQLGQNVRLDPRIVRFLLGDDEMDERLRCCGS